MKGREVRGRPVYLNRARELVNTGARPGSDASIGGPNN